MTPPPTGEKMDDLSLPSEIPVDEDYGLSRDLDYDDGSAYSIASTKYNFTWENGRLYHDYKAGHPFPYDERSQENEEVLHEMMLYIQDDKYFAAPVDGDQLKNVLDLGCGLGLWSEGVADRYPECNVLGVDSAPRNDPIIPNCQFELADVTEEWLFVNPSTKFDLVHIRSLFASLKLEDWLPLYKQCLDNMESGAWIEQIEVEIKVYCDDDTRKPDGELERLAEMTQVMSSTHGAYFQIAENMSTMMRDAGFTDVREAKYKLPVGWWSADPKYKEIGKFFERFYKTGLQGWLMHIWTKSMGFTPEAVNEACLKAFAEIDSRKHHYYFQL
ncbi:uncharacterized protein HMPREF1541_01027 [Cyphellophora europaea CBS 101466]|uniref:Methyltransferase domain-containing protein n=1 Tax=Cyphellophora europaea (strain CBS 101466) TaxID=1220924 RepID=W2SFN3_CYPE1|nr:uncharacterized protein HMPREF1541_01027 [Cyphellophora europaea CBS 101466]ETN46838.1 hypothetical protein HMPREF1541_01027 [Cyphellophora europaea CBS 101466]